MNDYDGLKTEIASQVARSDLSAADAAMDNFILQAEAEINRKLRVVRGTDEETLTTTANQDYINLPEDFLEIRSLEYDSNPKRITYVADATFGNKGSGTGRPSEYSLTFDRDNDRWRIRFGETPTSEYNLTLKYYAKVPALTSGNTTNWLLAYQPQLYLDGCLYYAFKKYRNLEQMGFYKGEFSACLSLLNAENQNTLFGPVGRTIQYQGSVV